MIRTCYLYVKLSLRRLKGHAGNESQLRTTPQLEERNEAGLGGVLPAADDRELELSAIITFDRHPLVGREDARFLVRGDPANAYDTLSERSASGSSASSRASNSHQITFSAMNSIMPSS